MKPSSGEISSYLSVLAQTDVDFLSHSCRAWRMSSERRRRPTETPWAPSCACTAETSANCRGTWKALLPALAPPPWRLKGTIRASMHPRTSRAWVRAATPPMCSENRLTSCLSVGGADSPAVAEGAVASGNGVPEQRHAEHRAQPAHRRGNGADRHGHHRRAGGAKGAAGPNQRQSETSSSQMFGSWFVVQENPLVRLHHASLFSPFSWWTPERTWVEAEKFCGPCLDGKIHHGGVEDRVWRYVSRCISRYVPRQYQSSYYNTNFT